MLQSEQIILLFADAYRQVALARANMRMAAEAIESMRVAMLSESEIFAAWNILDAQVNQAAEAQGLLPALMTLREQWKTIILKDECERLQCIFEMHSPETGWIAWLHSYGDALVQFRLDFARHLCQASLPFPEHREPFLNQIRLLTERARHARWAEAFDLYVRLGEIETLVPDLRVKLLAIASEIAARHFYQFDRAKTFLDQAEALGVKDWRLLYDWGNYYFWQPGKDNQTKAKEFYQSLNEQYPEVSLGYVCLGELLERENDLAGAAEKYRQAAKCLVSPSDGYASLLRLCSQKCHFERHRDEIPLLVERNCAVALSELDYYGAFIDAGYAFQRNDMPEEAHRWYRQAITFDPTRLQAYTSEAYLYLNLSDYANAINSFQQAIEVAPEALDGYWGMSRVTEDQQEWPAAIHWYEESLKRRPQWDGFIHARIGNIKRKLNQTDEATQEFFKALAADPNNKDARYGLEGIAANLYEQQGDRAGALQLYKKLRKFAGTDYEGTLHNLVGNLYFYFGEYQQAAEEYRQAITAAPQNARYYSNLALALECFRTPGHIHEELNEAITHTQRACELQPDFTDYTEQLHRLEQERVIVLNYGEQILTFEPSEKLIQVYVEVSLWPLLLDADKVNLSPNFLEKIAAMRSRIQVRSGFIIPGVSFSDLVSPTTFAGDYQIDVIGQQVAYGQLEVDRKFAFCSLGQFNEFQGEGIAPYLIPPVEVVKGYWLDKSNWDKAKALEIELIESDTYLLLHLEAVLLQHLDKLCDHQQAADLLVQCNNEKCLEISRDPQKLNRFTRNLKKILSQGKSIANLESICEKVFQETSTDTETVPKSERVAPEPSPAITSITLILSPSSPLDRAILEQELASLQSLLFGESGVVVPQIILAKSDEINPYDFRLQLDDQKLPVTLGLAPDELWVFVPYQNIKDRFPDSRESVDPNTFTAASILKTTEEVRQEIELKQYDTRDPLGYVIFCTAAELRHRLDQLLSIELVKYFMVKLKQDYPALINVASHYYTEQALTYHLQKQLKKHDSIKNLPKILETLLVEQEVCSNEDKS